MYVDGDPLRICEFLKKFIAELHGQAAQEKWRLCKLVLLAFVRDNISDMCRGDEGQEQLVGLWQTICERKRGLDFFGEFDFELKEREPSALKGWNFVEKADPKPYEACIFVLDRQMHEKILEINSLKNRWKQRVQAKWFDPLNTDAAESFLDRAEFFLVDSLCSKILGKVFETGSYVVFFRMDALTALLVREQCQIQHMLQIEEHPQKVQAAAPDDEMEKSSSMRAIRYVVSSANWHVWLAEGTSPSQAQVSEIVLDLQQIAHLPPDWLVENEVPLKEANVDVVCVEAAEIKQMPVKADTSWTYADLAMAVCDELVAQGLLKVHPTFIRCVLRALM